MTVILRLKGSMSPVRLSDVETITEDVKNDVNGRATFVLMFGYRAQEAVEYRPPGESAPFVVPEADVIDMQVIP